MFKITIVIPVYNRKNITISGLKNIQDSLNHYQENGEQSLDISMVVTDDGSTDGTGEWIRSHRPDIHIIEGNGNLWWSGSINAGARFAINKLSASHILLWNDDTLCEENYFYELEKVLNSDPKFSKSILVSKVFWLNGNGRLFNFGGFYYKATGKKVLIGLNEQDKYNQELKIDWSGGMGTLIPIYILESVGYLDEVNLPQYHGDIDFFLRAKEKGYIAFAIPNLKIYNNAETTGLIKAKSLKELSTLFTSNRSILNIKQNLYFNKRHSNTIISWFLLLKEYIAVMVKSIL